MNKTAADETVPLALFPDDKRVENKPVPQFIILKTKHGKDHRGDENV